MTVQTVRVALILCDVPIDPIKKVLGDYRDIFERWLQGALASYPDEHVRKGYQVHVDGFDTVGKGDWPTLDQLKPGGYDVVMISGSMHELDPPFIPKLIDYMRDIATRSDLAHLKIVGICFGHQIIAQAMGGTSRRGENGWEMGVYGCKVTPEGRDLFPNFEQHRPNSDKLFIQQMHRDHVPAPPPGFVTCLTTEKYPVQSMVKYNESRVPHIFSIQGHPEFVPELVDVMVEVRADTGVIDQETAVEARRRVWGKNKQGGEGLGCVGWSVWRMILSR